MIFIRRYFCKILVRSWHDMLHTIYKILVDVEIFRLTQAFLASTIARYLSLPQGCIVFAGLTSR